MKLIRKNVFETNSSSSHSLSINHNKKKVYDTLKVDSKGIVKINCGGYNFYRQYPRRTNNTQEKIAFFATLFAKTNQNKDLDLLRKHILKNTGAGKVKFLNLGKSDIEFAEDFKIPKGDNMYRALFDKNSWLFIQGDEYDLDDDVDEEEFYNPEEILE